MPRMPGRRSLLLALAVLLVPLAPASRADSPFPGCDEPDAEARVGVVTCRTLPSTALGGTTAFSYYVPPGCAPERRRHCPTLYLLHGFGGDLRSMLGTASRPSAWVAALSKRPAVSPYTTDTPWEQSDPATWVPASPLDVVLVAPDGRTVANGFGPDPGLEGFWADWNPRYAKGGDGERYGTPPPRVAASVVDELIPYVEAHFPVGRTRASRALAGTSLGGYGSYAIGLTHPDLFASLGAVSGIMNVLLVPGLDPSPAGGDGGVAAPVQLPNVAVPGPLGASVPLAALPDQARGFAVATYAFGDPAADQAYYRARMPRDLALNARAARRGSPSLLVRGFSNDAVPQPGDLTDPRSYVGAQAFEALVRLTNLEQARAFDAVGVAAQHEEHPGIHSDRYWNPWLRSQLEAQYAALQHADGSGAPPPEPDAFSYRSADEDVRVWGWHVQVRREASEFLQLTDVSCAGLTLRGSGSVTVTPPQRCHAVPVTVDLGPSGPTDAPGGLDAAPVFGRSVHVVLTRR